MADEIEQVEEVAETESEVVDEANVEPGTNPDKSAKTYTEAELQAKIKERVAREKHSSKSLQEQIDSLSAVHVEELGRYKGVMEKQVEKLKGDLPASVVKLLEKMDVYEQWEWLTDPENVQPMERKEIPGTPPEKKTKPKPKFSVPV